MTQSLDIDTFIRWFDDSTHEAHKHDDRTELPSSQVWQLVATRVSQSAQGEEDMGHTSSLNLVAIAAPGIETTRSTAPETRRANPSSRRTSGWIAAAVAFMVVVSGLYLNTMNNGGDSANNFAWAPATAEATQNTGHACDVVPLTTDEVMDMVLNPRRGYERLGQNTWPANLDELSESRSVPTLKLNTSGYREFGNDPDLVHEAVNAANLFSTCVSTGTAFQVWSLVDPSIVQIDIISRFPVLRTEAELRTFVEETGPLSYADHGGGYIPRFDGQAIHQGDGNWIIEGHRENFAIIPMAPVPFDADDAILNVSLRTFPNGQWVVTDFHYQIPGPQG